MSGAAALKISPARMFWPASTPCSPSATSSRTRRSRKPSPIPLPPKRKSAEKRAPRKPPADPQPAPRLIRPSAHEPEEPLLQFNATRNNTEFVQVFKKYLGPRVFNDIPLSLYNPTANTL